MYPVTVCCDKKGSISIGARNCDALNANGNLGAYGKRFGSQLLYVVSARMLDGELIITTRREARQIGAEILHRFYGDEHFRSLRNSQIVTNAAREEESA